MIIDIDMEIKMNLFHRKVEDYPDNDKEQSLFEHFEISTEWEENYNRDKDKPAKESYYPNALLFRSLLEGTSFDRRVKKKKEVSGKAIKTEPQEKETLDFSFKQKSPMTRIAPIKTPKKGTDLCKPPRKKKFITEKEQNRLGHIVKKVLGK